MDDRGRALRLDDRGPLEGGAGLEQLAVVDVGLVDALRREVDGARPLRGVREGPAGDRQPGRLELADLGDRDQVAADELDRRVEAVGVLALVRLVEGDLDLVDGGAFGQRDLDAVLLVRVAQVAVPAEGHLPGGDPLRLELRQRGRAELGEDPLDPSCVLRRQVDQPREEVVAA